jgi:uncharacterized protein (DUF1330 family)
VGSIARCLQSWGAACITGQYQAKLDKDQQEGQPMGKRAAIAAVTAMVGLSACAASPARAIANGADGGAATEAAPAAGTQAATDKPCYLVVMGTVTNREAFRAYAAALPPLYARYGGVYLAVQRGPAVLEGVADFESIVISRWPNCAAANAFWGSPAYRALVEMRKDWGRFTVVLTEGLAAPVGAPPMVSEDTKR